MKNVKLVCLSGFKYGESEELFNKDEEYDAKFEDGLYTIHKGKETVVLEDLSIFFKVKENMFRKIVRSRRRYTSKEEICLRMKWEDFSVGGVVVDLEDFEKVGLDQYAFNIKGRQDVQLRIKVKHNDSVIIQDNQKYEDILERINVKEDSVPVAKMLCRYSKIPTSVEANQLCGKYSSDLQGFLS